MNLAGCECKSLLIFHPLLFLFKVGKKWALSSDLTDLMPFQPSDLIEEVSLNPEVLAWNAWQKQSDIGLSALL